MINHKEALKGVEKMKEQFEILKIELETVSEYKTMMRNKNPPIVVSLPLPPPPCLPAALYLNQPAFPVTSLSRRLQPPCCSGSCTACLLDGQLLLLQTGKLLKELAQAGKQTKEISPSVIFNQTARRRWKKKTL